MQTGRTYLQVIYVVRNYYRKYVYSFTHTHTPNLNSAIQKLAKDLTRCFFYKTSRWPVSTLQYTHHH